MPLGLDDDVLAWCDSSRPAGDAVLGRVTRVDASYITLGFLNGESKRVELSRIGPGAVTGDWVWIKEQAAMLAIVPRRTAIVRAMSSGMQTLVSNVDLVGLCLSAGEAGRRGLIERLAAVAWDSGATPLFVITKADLVSSSEIEESRLAISALAPAIDVVCTSAADADGARELIHHIRQFSTSALIGHSGVGKSSLINTLTARNERAVGAVRERDAKGRHTTTSRQLIELTTCDAVVIDTPGLRELGLAVSDDVLGAVFDEISALARQCRFGDCAHESEPGCAVLEARDSGALDPHRLESYHRLHREIAFNSSKALAPRRDKGREYTRYAREYRRARGR